jgi:hypothetical protein
MSFTDRLMSGIWLALLGFLGFYVYGLVVGAFTPGEMAGFTVVAGIAVVMYAVHLARGRGAANELGDDATMPQAQRLRERRGF